MHKLVEQQVNVSLFLSLHRKKIKRHCWVHMLILGGKAGLETRWGINMQTVVEARVDEVTQEEHVAQQQGRTEMRSRGVQAGRARQCDGGS